MNSGYQNHKDPHQNGFKWCGIAKLRKNTIWTHFTEAKMTVCVCLSQYVCAWGSDAKRSFYDYESHVSSIRAPSSQAPARPYSGSATRRNNSSAFPIGDQSRGCCCAVWALPARPWCEALSCILGQGGQKWRFGRFYEISNFHDKTHPRSRIVCIASRKQKGAMFYLKRSSRFDNS